MCGALELIENSNNPKIVDAPDSSFEEVLTSLLVKNFHHHQRFHPIA